MIRPDELHGICASHEALRARLHEVDAECEWLEQENARLRGISERVRSTDWHWATEEYEAALRNAIPELESEINPKTFVQLANAPGYPRSAGREALVTREQAEKYGRGQFLTTPERQARETILALYADNARLVEALEGAKAVFDEMDAMLWDDSSAWQGSRYDEAAEAARAALRQHKEAFGG